MAEKSYFTVDYHDAPAYERDDEGTFPNIDVRATLTTKEQLGRLRNVLMALDRYLPGEPETPMPGAITFTDAP